MGSRRSCPVHQLPGGLPLASNSCSGTGAAVARQLTLFEEPVAVAEVPVDPGADYGEVFTRRWIVDLILDLVGYTPDLDLGARRLVEPSCGTGAFLLPALDRLIESASAHDRTLGTLGPAIRAFDLLDANASRARKAVALRLQEAGLVLDEAEHLAAAWVVTGDFLLHHHEPGSIDFVVGNPPYIRLENISTPLMDAYRRRCTTMRGRSDIYVGFIELGLDLLKPGGSLGFICADRWMRNQYGAHLRELITGSYAFETVISMHDVDAFEDDVSAYPAVVVLRRGDQGRAVVAEATERFSEADAHHVLRWMRESPTRTLTTPAVAASKVDGWFQGHDLWPCGSPARLALLAELESRFPPLEGPHTSTRVGIGVATGCDDVFITSDPNLVEADRMLPLVHAFDTPAGAIEWSGSYLVNPWDENGLVDLRDHPRLAAYFHANEARLRRRHVATRRPMQWFRTIDRVHPGLLPRPKLLLPDLKSASHPVLEEGCLYPHHNLYYVISDSWDLEVLGGLLLSDVANLFVGAYCVKMRGGCYRFQAQYLRRIRVPEPGQIPAPTRRRLRKAFRERDVEAATGVALGVYGVTSAQASALRAVSS